MAQLVPSWKVHVSTWLRFFAGTRLGPYHEMPSHVISGIIQLSKLSPEDSLLDIGCGNGRVLLQAVQESGVQRCTGLEINKTVAELARKNIQLAQAAAPINSPLRTAKFDILQCDARSADISSATVISLYLSERGNRQLLPILTPHLRNYPETRLCSFIFPIPTYEPIEILKVSAIPIFKYNYSSLPASEKHV
jgi:SAM-dependent methyltransferase